MSKWNFRESSNDGPQYPTLSQAWRLRILGALSAGAIAAGGLAAARASEPNEAGGKPATQPQPQNVPHHPASSPDGGTKK
jgi:hypothetical protein